MKKLIVLFVLLGLFSCSVDDQAATEASSLSSFQLRHDGKRIEMEKFRTYPYIFNNDTVGTVYSAYHKEITFVGYAAELFVRYNGTIDRIGITVPHAEDGVIQYATTFFNYVGDPQEGHPFVYEFEDGPQFYSGTFSGTLHSASQLIEVGASTFSFQK